MKKLIFLLLILIFSRTASAQLASIGGTIRWPGFPESIANGATTTPLAIDASGEKAASCFAVPQAGDIDQVGVRFGSVTSAQDLTVSLQDPVTNAASGPPDETQDQTGSILVASIAANQFVTTTLGANRTVSMGDIVCTVIEFTSTVGNLQISAFSDGGDWGFGYGYHKGGAGPTWTVQTAPLTFGIHYSGGTWAQIPGQWPAETFTSNSFSDASNPDERGNRFSNTFKSRARGACMWGRGQTSGDFTVNLYDAGDVSLASITHDTDVGNTGGGKWYCMYFTSTVELAANTTYRVAVKAGTSGSQEVWEFTVDQAAQMDMFAGGQSIYKTTRNNGSGSWTDTTTTRLFISLLLDQLDAGAGGGGGGGGGGRGIIGGQ